ncbi:MAG: hypothetical protein Q9191_005784 [Dirinaria sp. TL-2023a]
MAAHSFHGKAPVSVLQLSAHSSKQIHRLMATTLTAGPCSANDKHLLLLAGSSINRQASNPQKRGLANNVEPTTNGTNFEWLNQYGGESVISGVPHWSGIIIDLDNSTFLDASTDASQISNFSSTLDAKGGISSWSYTWSPTNPIANGTTFDIAYTMFAHKLRVNQAFVQLNITASKDTNASIVNVMDGLSAVRTDFVASGMDDTSSQIWTAVKPNGVDVTTYLYAAMESSQLNASTVNIVTDKLFIGTNDSSIAQAGTLALRAGTTSTVNKYVGAASSDGFINPQETAKYASYDAMNTGFYQSMLDHITEWAEILPEDSVDSYIYPNGTLPDDEFIVESAITAVLNEYYILQNTLGVNALALVDNAPIDTNSISVGGLASDSYGGLVFWDAEIWMQPGLATSHPASVRQIAKYRVERYPQARENAQTSYTSSKANVTFSNDAAVYSWTSGRSGNCTGTGPCFDYEYHINGDIAQEFVNYWVTSGDTQFFQDSLFPVYNSIATFYSELLTKNGSSYQLTNMTDPDEYANHEDNGGFTQPLIADTLVNANAFRSKFGMGMNETWNDQATSIFISRSSIGAQGNIIDEYTGMNGSIEVKQADVVLDTFPLNYQQNYTNADKLSDLEYYAGKQSLNGPGMTYAIFSIVASAVTTSGCASYTYQQYSENPYARAPWFQFSEQLSDDFTANGGTHPAFPFLTGHGGANQVTLFGYLGLRLTPEYVLHVDPSLPPQIPHLRYRTFYWQGWPISVVSNQTSTTLTRLSNHFTTANMTYSNTSIPVQIGNDNSTTYHLKPKSSLTLQNRNINNVTGIPGNIAQCLPVTSSDTYQPGQFPFSAVDGAASTKWGPDSANTTQSITVSLSSQPIQPIAGFYFDWAQAPPVNFSVSFSNSSNGSGAKVAASQSNVTIAAPYNPTLVAMITEYMSNTTNVTLESEVWSGRYATLSIWGNQNGTSNDGTGATVAEWAIIGTKGRVI